MRITQEADYALRIIFYLSKADNKNKLEAKVIAEHSKIPLRFTLKIMRKLTKGGLTASFRGIGGGYKLNKKPEDISIREVIEIIDGKIVLNRCLLDTELCTLHPHDACVIHDALEDAQNKLTSNLDGIKFGDLIKE